MKQLILSISLVLLITPLLCAQNDGKKRKDQTESVDNNTRFWEARLPGGTFMVALNRITSISKHTYYLGSFEVTEVVVDTDGNSLARFYTTNPIGADSEANIANNSIQRIQELSKEVADKAGTSDSPVIKEYPKTTHAKTVEFNLSNRGSLDALFSSVKRAWERNKGTRFTQR